MLSRDVPFRGIVLERVVSDVILHKLGPHEVITSLLAHNGTESRRILPVTIIAAVYESQTAILIGADSGQTALLSGLRSKVDKLERHPTAILVWGVSGNSAVAESFGRALSAY